jgi:hypothetical protein
LKRDAHLSYEDLLKILDACDVKDNLDNPGCVLEDTGLLEAMTTAIHPKSLQNRAVLGIDVYRYSQMDELSQSLVPFVFRRLYLEAAEHCRKSCPYLFHETDDELLSHFIDTGDGGFQLFDTPLQALCFALRFEVELRTFNTHTLYPRLRGLFEDDLTVRYAITYQGVFGFQGNYYGPAIITNSRIIARDKLNRCLVDRGTFDWFMTNTRGIENLETIGLKDLMCLPDFREYDVSLAKKGGMFPVVGGIGLTSHWKDIDILRIGEIHVKNGSLSVYSLHVHYLQTYQDEKDKEIQQTFTVTLGNLYTSGVADSQS